MTTSTTRMYPPVSGSKSISFNGRTYSSASGAAVAVPNFDVPVLSANGWTTTTRTAGALMAAIGDSITAHNSSQSAYGLSNGVWLNSGAGAPNQMMAEGHLNWASALTNQNVRCPASYMFGYSGQETSLILAQGVPSVLALNPRPSVCVVHAGTNDLTDTNSTFASITANLSSIYNQLIAANILVIAIPILPRSDITMTPTQCGLMEQVNAWIGNQALNTQGLYCADLSMYMSNPSSTSNGIQADRFRCDLNYFSTNGHTGSTVEGDLLHPSMRGAFYMGRAIAAVLNTIFPNQSTFISKNSTPWASGSNNYGNLLPNPQFLSGGTGSTLAAGVTAMNSGQVTNGYTFVSGGIASSGPNSALPWVSSATDTGSVTVSAGLVYSKNFSSPLRILQQLVFSGTYNKAAALPGGGAVYSSFPNGANFFRMYNLTPSGSTSPGDVLEGFLYVEIPAQPSLVGIGAVSMLLYNGSSQVVCSTMFPNYGAQPLDGWSGTLYLPPYTVQPSDGLQFKLQIFVVYEGSGAANATAPLSGTVNFGMPVLRKMIAPTLQ